MIEPTQEDLAVKAGTTYNKPWEFLNEDETPMDLTGWTARMQLRTSMTAEDVALELTTENGGIVIDEGNSTLTILILDDQTSALAIDNAKTKYVYDLEIIYPSTSYVDCPLYGKVTVSPEVTR